MTNAQTYDEDVETLECLDSGDPRHPCSGTVRYRHALSSTGRSFPRCDVHWDLRLEEQERITRAYPDSPSPPDWYDVELAGEAWDEE